MATVDSDDLWGRLASSVGRGSSGRWTALLPGLGPSVGGCATEAEAIAALQEAHAEAMADAAYRARAVDMATLPRSVQQRAHALENGEVMWRVEDAPSAIEALAGGWPYRPRTRRA